MTPDKIPALLALLDEESRTFLKLRHGLEGPRRTLTEIGRIMGRSRPELRQMEARILERLRQE